MRRRFLGNPVFDYTRYMTIESLEDGLFIQVPSHVEYTIDGTWKRLGINDSIEVNKGQLISFKKTNVIGIFGTFIINGRCNLRGNCMSMVFGDSGYKNNDLSELYAPFSNMFKDCTGIVSVEPTFLPATTLVDNCYEHMFEGCTSLVTAPELPATTLANNCYNSMFYGCSNLNYIKMLATDISAIGCFDFWVIDVASTGTFVKNAAMTSLPAGSSGIPEGWTVVNDGVNLITFYIADSINIHPNFVEYTAEEGMTWGEWIDSDYNTSDLYIGEYSSVLTPDGFGINDNTGGMIRSSDIIINGYEYTKG